MKSEQYHSLRFYTCLLCLGLPVFAPQVSEAQTRHGGSSRYMSYEGLVMTGYQGWFRAPGDGSGRGFVHWGYRGEFGDNGSATIDLWPDVSEYAATYPTDFRHADGRFARVFSSYDYSTVDTHFRWMQEYGVDGAFVQRFFGVASNRVADTDPLRVLDNALRAAAKYERAMAVMYDLSGLRPGVDDCSALIEDWKRLVDQLRLTAQGDQQSYLFHRGKPLVAIWGAGFVDRPYDIREIGLSEFIDFLKNDPVYGGCAVMLGVPAYFRELAIDTVPDSYLHRLIESVDIVMPWMVQRFSGTLHEEVQRYHHHVRRDLQWCRERGLDYVPVVYPGMSWYNLSSLEGRPHQKLEAIPRSHGSFYWMQIDTAIVSGARMLYVAMFDEVDEGTAIFKCDPNPPVSAHHRFSDMEGVAPDYYLRLTGQAGHRLREYLQP